MSEEEKAQVIHRMVCAGYELSYEQRATLRELHARFDRLWHCWEQARANCQAKPGTE